MQWRPKPRRRNRLSRLRVWHRITPLIPRWVETIGTEGRWVALEPIERRLIWSHGLIRTWEYRLPGGGR